MPGGSKLRDPRHRPQDDRLEIVLLKKVLTEFRSLHQEHLLILKQIEGLDTAISQPLETQVRRAAGLAVVIDRKVPDVA